MPDVIARCARLQPKPGKKSEYLRHLKIELEEVRKDSHLISILVHEGEGEDDRVMLYEIWRGTKARFFAEEMIKPYRAAYMKAMEELIDHVEVDWWDIDSEWGSSIIPAELLQNKPAP